MQESWSGASGGSLASVISSGKACHARARSGTGRVGGGRRKLSSAVAEARPWAGGGRGVRLGGRRWEQLAGQGRPHLRVHIVRRVTEEAAGRVLVQVHGLVDDCDAIVDVTHLVAHRRLVRGEAPLIVHDKLVLVRACRAKSTCGARKIIGRRGRTQGTGAVASHAGPGAASGLPGGRFKQTTWSVPLRRSGMRSSQALNDPVTNTALPPADHCSTVGTGSASPDGSCSSAEGPGPLPPGAEKSVQRHQGRAQALIQALQGGGLCSEERAWASGIERLVTRTALRLAHAYQLTKGSRAFDVEGPIYKSS